MSRQKIMPTALSFLTVAASLCHAGVFEAGVKQDAKIIKNY